MILVFGFIEQVSLSDGFPFWKDIVLVLDEVATFLF